MSYSITVPYYTNGVVFTAVLSAPTTATLTINGVLTASSTQSAVQTLVTDPLNGANTIVAVTGIAQDGSSRTWTWTIFRPAVPAITATVNPCATYTLDVTVLQTRYFRVIMPAGEFLHIIGTSNQTGMAPVMYLRKNALPLPPTTFDASSHATVSQSYSYLTALFAAPATTYYVQFSASSFAVASAGAHKLSFSACIYSATNATVQGTVSGTVNLRQWTFFNAYPPVGFYPSSLLFFTDPTSVRSAPSASAYPNLI
jgi:hypothetical protein